MEGRSWVEVDLRRIKENALCYKRRLYEGQEIIAVVKANAYGLGAVPIARALFEVGIRHYAVSNIDEAIELRKGGVGGSILILSYTPTSRLADLLEYDVMQTVYSAEYAKEIFLSGVPVKVQIALDSGMHRLGIDTESVGACAKTVRSYASAMDVRGIFTHLAAAEDTRYDEFTRGQLERFFAVSDELCDLDFEFLHALNSAGGIRHNTKRSKFVRVGLMLYGICPSREVEKILRPLPVMKWKSTVFAVKTVRRGEYIGYGLSYRAERELRIATVSTGYADGFDRRLGNLGTVFADGVAARIIGRVCMDQLMIDITEVQGVKAGDTVTLLDYCYTAKDMAKEAGTIAYEIISGIGNRVPRFYLNA